MPVIGIDAPTGGLNGIDSVDAMPPTDAVVLDNWLARSGFCESRPGYTTYSDDLGGPVETLLGYKGITQRKLIAGANFNLYDVTTGGNTSIGSGYANNRWQGAMINDKLILCNGADPELAYDGSTLTPLDYTGSAPPITPGEFIGVTIFKSRAYYWKKTDTSFWYAQAGSYQGELNEFDLGPVLQLGGTIVSMFTWTLDSGTGPDDILCITTDVGELILYQGDDPGNVGFFEQIGRFNMPNPLSVRGHMKYGSDVILMTVAGYVNLTTVMKVDQVSDYPAFSRKIARFVEAAGDLYADNYGHECVQAVQGYLIFNVPTRVDTSIQYVMDATTGNWSRFIGASAITFEVFDSGLYFGSPDGTVKKAQGFADDGEPIALNALPAYNYLGNPGVNKHLTAAQILSTFPDPKLIEVNGFADFTIPQLSDAGVAPGPIEGSLWNTELWNTVQWTQTGGVGAKTTKGWQNVSAYGYAVTLSVQMKVASQKVIWRQTGLQYIDAGAY
jgi:hypothetical protein